MLKLTIVTPEKRLLINQEVQELTVPGHKGELNILPGHAPLITTLETGIMKWKLKGQEKQEAAVISWGYCQVSPEGVNVLANLAELPSEINVEAVQKFLAETENQAMNELISDEDWAEFQRNWAFARAKLDLVQGDKK